MHVCNLIFPDTCLIFPIPTALLYRGVTSRQCGSWRQPLRRPRHQKGLWCSLNPKRTCQLKKISSEFICQITILGLTSFRTLNEGLIFVIKLMLSKNHRISQKIAPSLKHYHNFLSNWLLLSRITETSIGI